MPLSKGAIAGIVAAVVIVLGVGIWAAVYFSKKSTPAAQKYACDSTTGTCSQSDSGTYNTSADCQAACTPGVFSYNCDPTTGCSKIPGTTGTYPNKALCSQKCQQLGCDSSQGTCTATSDKFQDLDACKASCQQTPTTHSYNCDPTTGCSKIPGTTGTYATSALCSQKCKQLGCDSSQGTCTATSDKFQDLDACKANCQKTPTTSSYNCDPTTGCSKIPGTTGTYATNALCSQKCKQLGCDSSQGTCTATSDKFQDQDACKANCTQVPPSTGCSAYRVSDAPLNRGTDWSLGSFTDAMSKTYSYPFTNVRVTYADPKNSDTVVTGQRMMAYVGDWVDSGATKFAQWAATYGLSNPTYSITGTPDAPFLYVPQLGTLGNISKVAGSVFDPSKSYSQDARTLNGIPGILIENLQSKRSYRVYMGQPPSMQASERFADNHFGYHNPTLAGSNLRNTWYWDFRARTDDLPMDTAYLSASTDLYSSYQDPTSKSCLYYQANMLSTQAMSAKLWPHGPARSSDSVYVDFTDAAPLNGQFGVISGGGFQAKGMDLPNKMGPTLPTVLIKPNADVGGGLRKNVLEMRTYITWDAGTSAFKVVTSGGLISSKKWASGRYEIRAKVGNRPGLVWAIWNFTAVFKLPSPMSNCGTGAAACVACMNCTDYSTCCSQCSPTAGTKCGTCGAPGSGGAACASDSDCSGGQHCSIPVNANQCNCKQCQSGGNTPPSPTEAMCAGYDCSKAIACGWDTSKKVCTGSTTCAQYTTQDACNNSTPCQGTLTWKQAAPAVGIKTPWNSVPEVPQNIYYVGAADINDPSSAGPNYKTAASSSVQAGAMLGGMPCSSYYNMEADFCEIPSNAPFFSNMPKPPPDTVRPTSHTANLNTYRFTNSAGTGTYTNYYVEAQVDGSGKKQAFIGDGCYHTYAYELHTGDAAAGIRPKVDAFFDGDYIGTSDSFVPDVFSRLWFCSWNTANPNWNGYLGSQSLMWSDVTESVSTTVAPRTGTVLYNVNYIDYVRIEPFNEANDKFMPDPLDQSNMNQVMDPSQVGMDSQGNKLPGGSGYKQTSCCALVSQPSPYDGTTPVQMCSDYAYHTPTPSGIDWTNPTLKCAPPLNGDKTAVTVQSQTMVPFFQTKTAITTADGIQAYGVIWNASVDELNPGGGGGGGGGCTGANVACPKGDSDCTAYMKTNNCASSCTSYCRTNGYCHISC